MNSHRLKIVMLILIVSCAPVRAAEESSSALDQSISRGLVFLSKNQNSDGSFDGGGPKVAMTGLVLISFLSAGHTPGAGKHGALVRSATDYLLNIAPDDVGSSRVDLQACKLEYSIVSPK